MRQECIEAVQNAIGRSLKVGEAQGIEDRIRDTMRIMARRDTPKWRSMSDSERLLSAADEAAQSIAAEGSKKRQRVALQIGAHDRVMTQYSQELARGRKAFPAVARVLDRVDVYAKGVGREYFSDLLDTIEGVKTKWLGFVEDAQSVRNFTREVFGESTGDVTSAKAARAWLDTVENMRQRFNRAGGDVGKLDYGYLPQPHDQVRVLRAGREKWVQDVLPRLDRRRYVNVDGSLMDEAQLRAMLDRSYETISTGGLNKLEPGKPLGNGSRANRGSDSREIHFKDADAYLDYARDYGTGGVMGAMQGHISRLAKDIALVESMGPNPETMFQFLHDTARKTGATDRVGTFMVQTSQMWKTLNGSTGMSVVPGLADLAQGIRNIEVFGKLQGAFLSSVTDLPTYLLAARYNKLPVFESLKNLVYSFGSESRDFANRAGLIADSVISDMNRWAEGNIMASGGGFLGTTANVTGKFANATMKASLLDQWTNAQRRAFSLTMMGALGKITRKGWGELAESDRARLTSQGVTDQDFKVWSLATPEKWRESVMLTPDSIRAIPEATLQANGLSVSDIDHAVSKALGVITDESEYASLAQNLETRAAVTRGTQKGTVEGEFLRSIMLFKGFPMAMISRHWARIADQWRNGDRASAVAYAAGLSAGLTTFGALAMQMKDLASGKDPRDMTTPKFWGAALAQGGGAGILGDILYTGLSGETRAGSPNWTSLAGPVIGSVGDLANLTLQNAQQAAAGKDTHAGAELFRFARGHLPFVNLWYAKAVLDRAVLNDLQEQLSPGYMSRMESRMRNDWNQGFWAPPDGYDHMRWPDLGKAVGE